MTSGGRTKEANERSFVFVHQSQLVASTPILLSIVRWISPATQQEAHAMFANSTTTAAPYHTHSKTILNYL